MCDDVVEQCDQNEHDADDDVDRGVDTRVQQYDQGTDLS